MFTLFQVIDFMGFCFFFTIYFRISWRMGDGIFLFMLGFNSVVILVIGDMPIDSKAPM
jgi:hypothetical protein